MLEEIAVASAFAASCLAILHPVSTEACPGLHLYMQSCGSTVLCHQLLVFYFVAATSRRLHGALGVADFMFCAAAKMVLLPWL
jgi:hypothetical protein